MRGVVSAGMCVLLEQAGLIDAIDVIYGVSSGALNGSFTAAGQAALGATNYGSPGMIVGEVTRTLVRAGV